ncbi:MAG: RNA polymerase subunit sigma-70 [Planctomycetaceae bacterium]|jgi:RNA polymerase sigma-70 factor (ECF subfamily)|nr:RNA polymerase subunit sigma-70 [Planctomycetaceae bacterium]
MREAPETRPSLLLRLRDARDDQAWTEFQQIYEPLIYRLARRNGFQDADARELTQEVLLAVSKAIDQWDPDPKRGSFRGWLFRIARNLMINYLTKQRRHPQGSGDTDFNRLLNERPAVDSKHSAYFDHEYRRQTFRWAAEQIREGFQKNTWQAFWLTCVDGKAIKDVADELKMSAGAIYVARSRVMAKLRTKVEQLRED